MHLCILTHARVNTALHPILRQLGKERVRLTTAKYSLEMVELPFSPPQYVEQGNISGSAWIGGGRCRIDSTDGSVKRRSLKDLF